MSDKKTGVTNPQPPAEDEKKPEKHIECRHQGCKAISHDEDTATKDGWYLSECNYWYCHQHNPTLINLH